MRRLHILFGVSLALGLTIMVCACHPAAQPAAGPAQALTVEHSQNTGTVPAYEVFEITFRHEGEYGSPFFDVTIEVTFTSPTGKAIKVGGFHYGSLDPPKIEVTRPADGGRTQVRYIFEKADVWKARFAPAELGRWTYSYVFANTGGQQATGSGAFECVKGRNPAPGFVRQDPDNAFRWVFDDGTPYFPIGLQNGVFDNSGTGSAMDEAALEGPFRLDRANRPEPPPGAMFKPGPSSNPQNMDVYLRRYGQCGFNLLRFSQRNFSLSLYNDLDNYLVQEAVMVDELLRYARKYGFRVFYGIFGFGRAFNDEPGNADGMAKVKRFIKYTVDRWGPYVDFWEFLNEQRAADGWYEALIPYLRSLDPYQHPITTSWERPELGGIEVSAPHWYVGIENELNHDQMTASRAAEWKRFGKPVVVGENGNHTRRDPPPPPGVGGVWDPGSALRMRLRNWAALFNEISFIFWNTSYAKDGHFMNIWLGPKEREYVRAMQDYAYCLGRGLRTTEVAVSDPASVRAYGLASDQRAGVYLHHFRDHDSAVTGLNVTLDVPREARGYWYSPETAAILGSFEAAAGERTVRAPEFTVDIALLITPDGAPDIDRDGKGNDADPDDDNDGVPDVRDAFPLEPEEWEDGDGDLIGDSLDADADADGVGDDHNNNGTPDHEELDLDADGVERAGTVPWDAFPLDPKEWRDTDGDGIGDNADTDDDGDGYPDRRERRAGTDPLDRLSFPKG